MKWLAPGHRAGKRPALGSQPDSEAGAHNHLLREVEAWPRSLCPGSLMGLPPHCPPELPGQCRLWPKPPAPGAVASPDAPALGRLSGTPVLTLCPSPRPPRTPRTPGPSPLPQPLPGPVLLRVAPVPEPERKPRGVAGREQRGGTFPANCDQVTEFKLKVVRCGDQGP